MENEKNLQPDTAEETTPEEILSEEERLAEELSETPDTPSVPRPLWQRIGAWICLVAFICLIIMYYINIMRGGL